MVQEEAIPIEHARMCALIKPGAQLERLWTGAVWSEGPVWWEDGSVTWGDIPDSRMMGWSTEDVTVFRAPSNHANGHTRDREGRLVSCEHSGRRISRTEADGTIWFTDPPYGILSDDEGAKADSEIDANHLYRFDPESGLMEIAADDFDKPNGLAFSPDENLLYISDTGISHRQDGPRHIRVFEVEDGRRLVNGRVFAVVTPGASDGFRIDVHGNVFTSAHDGIQVFAPEGPRPGRIRVPEIVANCTFGGPAGDRLIIAAGTSLYAIGLATKGCARP